MTARSGWLTAAAMADSGSSSGTTSNLAVPRFSCIRKSLAAPRSVLVEAVVEAVFVISVV